MPADETGGRAAPATSRRGALAEFLVVGGASLAVIFWIVPWQTSAGSANLGLSPRMLPLACAGAIGVLALVRLIRVLLAPAGTAGGAEAQPAEAAPPIWVALALMATAIAGIVAIRYIGWPAGGAVLSLLVVLVLGELRWTRLAALPLGTALLLYLIQQTGI